MLPAFILFHNVLIIASPKAHRAMLLRYWWHGLENNATLLTECLNRSLGRSIDSVISSGASNPHAVWLFSGVRLATLGRMTKNQFGSPFNTTIHLVFVYFPPKEPTKHLYWIKCTSEKGFLSACYLSLSQTCHVRIDTKISMLPFADLYAPKSILLILQSFR